MTTFHGQGSQVYNSHYERVGGDQGFVTTTGRFVLREEARKIAEAAGQLIASDKDDQGVPIVRQHRELFSEDVW